MLKKILIAFSILLNLILFSYLAYTKTSFLNFLKKNNEIINAIREKPLDKYAFENLRQRSYPGSLIEFGKVVNDQDLFTSMLFYFSSDGKKVSGLANLPKNAKNAPVIILVRGFVNQEIYKTGTGTQHVGETLAKNGFVTLSPDFLGYGESASPSSEPIEERFETYTTVLNLLSSVKYLNQSFNNNKLTVKVNPEKIGLWGHSNGGHIALSILEISGSEYPTVLWAPVSKPFPFSILYFTDEYEDFGKKLRAVVANFEKNYDADKYSLTSYFDWIRAPIQLHQGTADDAVPQKWSDQFVTDMKKLDKDVSYYTYPGDDHNFARGSWNLVVQRNIAFFKKHFDRLSSSE